MQLFFLLLFVSVSYSQQNEIYYNEIDSEKLKIEKQYVFSEKEFKSDINFVLKNDAIFTYLNKAFVNQGIYNKRHWIKIPLFNNSNNTEFVYEFNQTNIDSLTLYLVKNNIVTKAFKPKGLHFSQNNKSSFLQNRYAYVYDLNIAKKDSLFLYVKANVNDDSFKVVNVLWSKEKYTEREKDIKIRSTYLIVFLGFVFLIILLSLAMYFFTKQNLYVYYIGFLTVVFLQILGVRYFISPLIIEKYLFFGNNFEEMLGLLVIFFVMHYTDSFLSLKDYYPKVSKITKYAANFAGALFIAALFLRQYEWFFGFSYIFSKVFLLIISVTLYVFAFKLALKKNLMGYYFLIAYGPLMIFMGHFILTAMKLTNSYNPLEWEFVIFIEILVLTIAMAHRYYLMMKQNIDYQKAIIKEQERGLQAMIEAQENERGRIARELHDGVVQQIGSVILKSRNILSKMNLLHTKDSQELLDSLENSNKDLRTISHQMMPRALKELGITSALNDLLENSLSYKNITFTFEHFNIKERLPKKIEITIYRIVQELLNNIIKHSKATEVSLQLYNANNVIILIVEDNGIGFTSENNKKGIGLLNITSRLDMVNGNVNFEPSPKSGTLVTIKIPLQ
ncbi:sensor histidine kinase [Polaribacter sp. Hel1_85]|nr:sensor histidine kinase [Polaribacter sp. Hel1_85]